MTDFIIVGRGLAATVLMHAFRREGISFQVIGDPALSSCSRVAAGIWNPVVFKRMTRSWMAEELIGCLLEFYSDCEKFTGTKLLTHRDIVKPFSEEQEKTLWQKKAGGVLRGFIDPEIYDNPSESLRGCTIAEGYGRVLRSGNLDVKAFIDASAISFSDRIITERFDHGELDLSGGDVSYKSHTARNIVFCEGHLVKSNPLFKWIPLRPAKGEILTISAPGLGLSNAIFNRNGFLMPLSDDRFRAGATYEWGELSDATSPAGLQELEQKVRHMTQENFRVEHHEAGVRPSSLDRRPVVGPHPEHHQVFVFNGLGTKGVMLAPFFAKNFVHFFLQKEALNAEINIKRFYDFYAPER